MWPKDYLVLMLCSAFTHHKASTNKKSKFQERENVDPCIRACILCLVY